MTEVTQEVLELLAAAARRDEASAARAEGLQSIRDRLFNLKGYLEGTGFPHIPLTWVEEAIEAVTFLQQTMGE